MLVEAHSKNISAHSKTVEGGQIDPSVGLSKAGIAINEAEV